MKSKTTKKKNEKKKNVKNSLIKARIDFLFEIKFRYGAPISVAKLVPCLQNRTEQVCLSSVLSVINACNKKKSCLVS